MRTPVLVSTAVIAATIVMLAAELLVRARGARGAAVPLKYYPHARLERALVRNVDYGGKVHVNRLGFRGPDFVPTKPQGMTRIMAVGFSSTFSPCVGADSAAWPARLEHWLHTLAPGRRFHVINAGVPGTSLVDLTIRMQTELFAFQPDVVLMYASHGVVGHESLLPSAAELALDPPSDIPNAAPATTPWGGWLARHSVLYSRLRARLHGPPGRSNATKLTRTQWDLALSRAAENFKHDLRALMLVSRGTGARFVLVQVAHMSGTMPAEEIASSDRALWMRALGQPPELILAGYRRFTDVSRQLADSLGATFIQTGDFGISGRSYYCAGDPIQFNDAGSDLMGRRLAEELLRIRGLTGGP